MRVAFISFGFPEYSVRLASALAEHATILLLLPEGSAKPFLNKLDHRVIFKEIPRARLREPLKQFRCNQWIMRQVREFSTQVLHVQQGSLWFNISLTFVRGIPLILTVHDAEPHPGDKDSRKTPYFFWKLGFRQADHIIAHTQHIHNELQHKLAIPASAQTVIPHIQIGQARKPCTNSEEVSGTVMFFGRIWPYKGLEYLIKAEPFISRQFSGVRFIIAGAGEDVTPYRRMMVHPERFTIINRHIPEEEADQLFREASVLVLPYIESSQSGVIPVAYTYGKPVVATRVGGLPESVVDGVTGFLVPPRNENKLAESILAILKDDSLRQQMGRAAREYIETVSSPDVIARKTFEVYRRLCSE